MRDEITKEKRIFSEQKRNVIGLLTMIFEKNE